MLLNEFPDLSWLKAKINQRFNDRVGWKGIQLESPGWPTVLLRVKAQKIVRDQVKGPLSIFTNISGSGFVSTHGTRSAVNEDTFFISNAEQLYTLEINQPVETFNIHIGDKLAEDVFYACSQQDTYLLDHPDRQSNGIPVFFNKTYWKDPFLKNAIKHLSISTSKTEEQEILASLIEHLMVETNQIKAKTDSIALKASTKAEISRRLFKASDYIHAHYKTDISLDDLSRVSCLSKYHFLRTFKITFGETPHQFVTRLRIEKAKEYLENENLEVKEIADRVGFPDASSFSRSFKRRAGYYPLKYIQESKPKK